jgi:hypothetical protein
VNSQHCLENYQIITELVMENVLSIIFNDNSDGKYSSVNSKKITNKNFFFDN